MPGIDPLFGSIVPSQKQQLLDTNYLSFNGGTGDGDSDTFAQQYLPEIYEKEVERYGNRTLSGFLRMVGAEMPMTSDQVIWSEQNRLHIAYDGCTNTGGTSTITIPVAADVKNVISVNQTVVLLDAAGNELKAVVTSSNLTSGDVVVAPYTAADTSGLAGTVKMFVYGSEYSKGSSLPNNTSATTADGFVSVDPSFTQFSNSPIIIRSKYVVSGSDTAQIGWVEVATEDGTGGYLWYLKAESETRLRFEDYLEMSVIEGEKAAAGSAAADPANGGFKGTEGLFAAIQTRGNEEVGFNAAGDKLEEFDAILRNLDTQGAIEENMLFLNRETSLGFDDMLAGVGAPQGAGSNYGGGSSYGIFENSEDMALNLGFSGFRRGSYDFYKTDWKYLNDASTRGGIEDGLIPPGYGVSAIDGVLIPAGTSTVYDQILGTNIRRPFLHVRYRASQTDDRRMKSWLTGSVGGAFTSDLDAMEVNFLSERCLCVQGANNFVLFTK